MRDVDRSWQSCLTAYARRHRDWLARLEREGFESTPLAPLVDLRIDASWMTIELGEERHRLPRPQRIIELTDDGGDAGLAIELGDRTIVLRFRVSARPEDLS